MKKLFGFFLALLLAFAPVNVGQATLVSLPSPYHFPGILANVSGAPSISATATLDAAGEYAAYAFVAREDMVISHVGFRAVTVAGSPTAEVRIETLDPATGLPSGTLWAVNTNATSATITSNSNPLTQLTAAASITKGQTFCVKIVYASGTSIQVGHIASITPNPYQSTLPYQILNVGTPTKAITAVSPTIALGSSATTFYQVPGAFPISAYTAGAFNNTNSAKRGILFTPPMNGRVIGVRWFNSGNIGDFDACVRTGDASGTELNSSCTSFEGDNNSANFTAGNTVYFDNPVTVTVGTAYRVSIEPSSATNVNVSTFTLPSADYFSASPAGATAVYTSFVTATWTDSTTQLPLMDVIFDQVDNGAGSGGGSRCIGC